MALDLPTLFVIAVLASAISGLLLLLSWLQNRNVAALALWATAFMLGSAGVALIAARGDIPDVWSITIANAIIATAYGIMWGGARNFDGRPTPMLPVLAGAAIWLLACQSKAFFDSQYARTALMSAVIVTYSVLTAWEFWQGRNEGLMSRIPIVGFLLAHAAIVVIRIPFAGSLSLALTSQQIRVDWWTFIIFEAVFFSFCTAYLLGGIAKERIVLRYKHASLIDPLTGVSNRRDFLERGKKLLHRTAFDRRPVALLLFDLDKFKGINDSFGHHAGDRVLIAFCEVATATLRPGDLFGRLGGEEFAALLPQASLDSGLGVAERVRAKFETTALDLGASKLTATVSVGVAVSAGRDRDLGALFAAADRALYRAKTTGRNRIASEHVGSDVGLETMDAAPHRMPG